MSRERQPDQVQLSVVLIRADGHRRELLCRLVDCDPYSLDALVQLMAQDCAQRFGVQVHSPRHD